MSSFSGRFTGTVVRSSPRLLARQGLLSTISEAGLYLWSTRDEPCRDTVDWFAERGILVAPGEFYGPKGVKYVRVALTGTDDQITAAAQRIAG